MKRWRRRCLLISNEQYLAGAILIDEQVAAQVADLVSVDDFQDELCQAVFQSALTLHKDGRIIDPISIAAQAKRNQIDLPVSFLAQLMELVPTAANCEEYARRVADDSRMRKIVNLAAQVQLDNTLSPEDLRALLQQSLSLLDEQVKPGKCLEVISAQDLQNADIPPVQFLVEDLLPEGTSLICAASKIGKSWMVLDMGLSIAAGEKFLGRDTQQCGVLYLALEDSKGRLQSRMHKILQGASAPAQFYFSTEAPNLDDGLLDILGNHLGQHPEIKLVIIDTLQKIRGRALPREGAYEMDYRHMAAVKTYTDKRGVSVLFVHHIRKMRDDGDPFNMISGTNGIMGAADTAWIISKDRSAQDATLHITGRDVAQAELIISFDKDNTWKWRCRGTADWLNEQRAKLEYQNNPIVKTIRQLLQESENRQWSGTASELMKEGQRICGYPVTATPHEMGQSIKKLSDLLLENDHILHKMPSNGNAGRKHFFYDQSWVLEAEQAQEAIPL